MKGTINWQSNNSYRVRVSVGKDPTTGKYIQHSETVKGPRKQAEKRLRELLTEMDKGTFVIPSKSTLGAYLKSWLLDYCKPNLQPKTIESYTYLCNKHIYPTIGGISLVELRPSPLQHLYAEKRSSGLSNRTVQLIHLTIHKALQVAVKAGLLSRNVADAVEAPKVQRRDMKTLSETDLHIFLEMARETEYYSLFYTLLFTGMRRNEALALRWQDVDLLGCQLSVARSMQCMNSVPLADKITFKQPKTLKSRRMIALSPSTVGVLREHLETQSKQRLDLGLPPVKDTDLVFCHWDGTPLLPESVSHGWMRLARCCGMPGIRLHDARHSHASLLLKQNVHPKVVSERLGHAGIAITLDLYSHVAPGIQQAAANKFDDLVLPSVKTEQQIKI